MDKLVKSRYGLMLTLFTILMAVLVIRLFVLTVVTKDTWVEKAEKLSTRSITTSAPRGNIYDRNGKVLATNRQTFNIRMYNSEDTDEDINKVIGEVVKLLDKNGDRLEDDFPITISENGRFEYTFDKSIRRWLKAQDMPENYTAQQAFDHLRSSLGIDPEMSVYDAQAEIHKAGIYPPISVGAKITYSYDLQKESFLERYGLEKDTDAKTAFKAIREKYKIEDSLSDRKARETVLVRDALDQMGYTKYMPVTIAVNVSDATIIEIEEETTKYRNVEVSSEYVRDYPNGSVASHILGYLGSISDADKEEYVDEKGYDANELIGQDGIEKTFESTLRGESGSREIKVDVFGNLVEVLDENAPVSGEDVTLTIDLKQQKNLEKTLKKGINCVRTGNTFHGNGVTYTPQAVPRCETGAAVILDVKTGEVIAMASYPDFDPNLFAEGISESDWNSLQTDNIRDPLSPQPLYNIATRSAVQPGSTFKPVTATAALANGLDPNKKLHDGGQVKLGDQTYDCLVYTRSHSTHGNVDLSEALGVSCNYYFYDIGQGKDYYNNTSLGYKCDVDEILKYARAYGLGEDTGIELAETTTKAPSAELKMENTRMQVENDLWTKSSKYFKKEVYNSEEKLTKCIETISSWTEENPEYEEIIDRLPNCGVKKNMVETVAAEIKYSYFEQAGWTEGDALNISIGQGENAYTPLQLANYAATIGNRGKRNTVTVVKSVNGEESKSEEAKDIGVKSSSFDYILKGMHNVTKMSGGSLYSLFNDFDIDVAAKTGTAERAGRINTKDEVAYVRKHLSQLTSEISWDDVEKEMNRILETYPNTYKSRDTAVRQALYNLSDGKITGTKIDRYKPEYENFAWTMALAPAKDPEIAVCVLLVQGKSSLNAGFITREIIADYFGVDEQGE